MLYRQKLFLAVALILASSGASANFIHTYMGFHYTHLIENSPSYVYTASMNVFGYFETEDALPVSNPGFDAKSDVLSYSISDGISTLTQSNSTLVTLILSTNVFGQISIYSLDIFKPYPTPTSIGDTLHRIRADRSTLVIEDSALTLECFDVSAGTCIDQKQSFARARNPGAWISSEVVPEPTTFLLLGIGLAGLGFSRRRLH